MNRKLSQNINLLKHTIKANRQGLNDVQYDKITSVVCCLKCQVQDYQDYAQSHSTSLSTSFKESDIRKCTS